MEKKDFLTNKWSIGVYIALFFFGYWLSFVHPAKLAQEELNVGIGMHDKLVQRSDVIKKRLDSEKWLNREFVSKLRQNLSDSQRIMLSAETEIKNAENAGSEEKASGAKKAQELLEGKNGVLLLLDGIEEQFALSEKATNQALEEVGTGRTKIESLRAELSVKENELSESSGKFLSKYVSLMKEQILQARGNLQASSDIMLKAEKYLPAKSDTSSSADPFKAVEVLVSAKKALADGENLAKGFFDELQFQIKALSEAKPKTKEAEERYGVVAGKISGTARNTKLSLDRGLKSANSKVVQAASMINVAKKALQEKVDGGKFDCPLAYRNALEAIKVLGEASGEVDLQVKLMAEVGNKIDLIKSELTSMRNGLTAVADNQSVLDRFHHQDSVSDIYNNIEKMNKVIFDIKASLSQAERLGIDEQDFKSALVEIQAGNKQISSFSVLINESRNKQARLEETRNAWLDRSREAKSAIDDEEGDVSQYGRYSSSAVSDFNEAVDLLNKAQSYASGRKFIEANDLAEKAHLLVDGTGNRALQGYNDYQDEQRRQEEEQRRAEEERNRPSSSFGGGSFNSDSSSSSSSSGGFSSYGSSSGSSSGPSDGGIFNSSPSDGGGY